MFLSARQSSASAIWRCCCFGKERSTTLGSEKSLVCKWFRPAALLRLSLPSTNKVSLGLRRTLRSPHCQALRLCTLLARPTNICVWSLKHSRQVLHPTLWMHGWTSHRPILRILRCSIVPVVLAWVCGFSTVLSVNQLVASGWCFPIAWFWLPGGGTFGRGARCGKISEISLLVALHLRCLRRKR